MENSSLRNCIINGRFLRAVNSASKQNNANTNANLNKATKNAGKNKPLRSKTNNVNPVDSTNNNIGKNKPDISKLNNAIKKKIDSQNAKQKKIKDPNALPENSAVPKFFLRLFTSLKRVGIQYTEDFGTTLPGYMDSTKVLGSRS